MARLLLLALSSLCFVMPSEAASHSFYTAAVFEHARYGSLNDSAVDIIATNLNFYKMAAREAGSKGVDIIVYPEYGIFPPNDRQGLKPFLEHIPDPRKNHIPCDAPDMYSDRPILFALSCIAKHNSMYVVANTGDTQSCSGGDCPPDGVFQYNTNVVFDRKGRLILKYYKEHLFFELGMDLPQSEQDPTFETDFGVFSTYICFDVVFQRMSDLAKWRNVSGVAYSSMWFDQPPLWNSVQLWQAWAMANNSTMLAANIQHPGAYSVGSGIFDRHGYLEYTYNPDGISKLVVARVPKRGFVLEEPLSSITAVMHNKLFPWTRDGEDVKRECSEVLLNKSSDIYTDYRCYQEKTQNYTFVELKNPNGYLEACHNGMCCSVDYSVHSFASRYYLGVYNGSQNLVDRYYWCEENCVLATCEGADGGVCGIFPRKSDTVFRYLHLRGNFTTYNVQPSVLESGMRLVPRQEWHHEVHGESPIESYLNFYTPKGKRIISAGLKGRCFARDPPYIR